MTTENNNQGNEREVQWVSMTVEIAMPIPANVSEGDRIDQAYRTVQSHMDEISGADFRIAYDADLGRVESWDEYTERVMAEAEAEAEARIERAYERHVDRHGW
jgi:hypothetical protein